MKLLCLLVLLSISFTGVGQKIPVSKKHHAKDIHQVNLYKAYQEQGNLQLSTVAKSMQYIPLETRGGCLIGEYLKRIFITSTDIFILDFGQGAYRFTKEGKFVNKIGRIGKGPGEC